MKLEFKKVNRYYTKVAFRDPAGWYPQHFRPAVHLANPCIPKRFYRPFGAGRFINRDLGLKPQAESCSPFGTKVRQPLREKLSTPVHESEDD
jgi:hypothetical protein